MKNSKIQNVINILHNNSMSISEYRENNKLCGYEISTYTDAGVNMLIFIDFRDSKKKATNEQDFINTFNQWADNFDPEEEIKNYIGDKQYMNEIGLEVGLQDFKDWKENLSSIFSTKTPQQRQFEQVVDKFRTQLQEMQETLEMMPIKGNVSEECQRTFISTQISNLEYAINGVKLEDFTPNEYSQNFKLSYS